MGRHNEQIFLQRRRAGKFACLGLLKSKAAPVGSGAARPRCDGLSRCDPHHRSGSAYGGNLSVKQVMEVKMLRAIKVALVAGMLVFGFASFGFATITPAHAFPSSPIDQP
jgi:hypothetical protein